MKHKVIILPPLLIILASVLTLAFYIQPVKASGTIYIRADGSIEPPTANITSVDNVTYTFTDNINDSIVVERDNIVVDGAGYAVQGAGSGTGIDLSGRTNLTIKNMEIKAFDCGIWLNGSSGNTLSGNNITANNLCGIWLEYSSNYNGIYGNNITNSWYGIYLHESSNYNSIQGNNIANNKFGIDLFSSSNNSISGDNITANDWVGIGLYWSPNNIIRNCNFTNDGISIWGSLDECVQTIEGNMVNGKPLYYFLNQRGMVLDGVDVGQLILVNSTDFVIRNLNISHTDVGIQLLHSSNNGIYGNNITNMYNGIVLWYSSNNNIHRNNLASNWFGIFLSLSSGNIISGNNITNNWYGIRLSYYSNNNSISGNNITNNRNGIEIWYSSKNSMYENNIANNEYGFQLGSSLNNSISANNITANNVDGILLWSSSNYNNIYGNNVENNNYGIYLKDSSNNTIYHNNFVDNTEQVYSYNSTNVWDDGYPSGGNYWSDYNGTDANQDGIGDTPYIIDGNNTDNYPLMGMFCDFPISSIFGVKLEKTYHVTTISNSTITRFGLYPIIHLESGKWVGGEVLLYVNGPAGTKGFCRLTIPKDLLDCPEGLEYWTVELNCTDVTSSCNIWENSTHTFIYVPYNHSIQEISIIGTWIVPEFPSALILPLLLIVTLVTVAFRKTFWTERGKE